MPLRYFFVAVVSIVIAVIVAFRAFANRRKQSANHFRQDLTGFETGECDKAIADFTEAIRLDPQNVSTYHDRGLALDEKGDYDGAIADFTAAIQLDPNKSHSYLCRGNVWSQKGEHDKAIADFTEAIKLDRDDASPFYNRGNAFADKGDLESAISDYTEAIRGDPENAAAHFNRGLAWDRKGAARESRRRLRRSDPPRSRARIRALLPDPSLADGKWRRRRVGEDAVSRTEDEDNPGRRLACLSFATARTRRRRAHSD